MKPEEIADKLTEIFGAEAIQTRELGAWQVDLPHLRLLVILSSDHSWLRMLIPIAPAVEAQPFWEQLLQANFDETLETRYALNQNVLWGIFQHKRDTLQADDFQVAVERLVSLRERGLSQSFRQLTKSRMRQIIKAAKQRGQSLKATMQNLERFYREGLMGDLDQGTELREQVLATWQRQLESLWLEVEP